MAGRLEAALMGDERPIPKKMDYRKGRLDNISDSSKERYWGGIFDLIFRSKRERENAMRGIEDQM